MAIVKWKPNKVETVDTWNICRKIWTETRSFSEDQNLIEDFRSKRMPFNRSRRLIISLKDKKTIHHPKDGEKAAEGRCKVRNTFALSSGSSCSILFTSPKIGLLVPLEAICYLVTTKITCSRSTIRTKQLIRTQDDCCGQSVIKSICTHSHYPRSRHRVLWVKVKTLSCNLRH